jgi:hypothetical protein
MTQSTFLWEEPHAKPSLSPDYEKDWMILVATSHSPSLGLLNAYIPSGLFGKMSPVSCQLTEDERLEPSSGGWLKSGMGSHTGFLTLNTLECHKDAGVCSLSGILETTGVPQRFYLSAKACAGILRRAEKRGKKMPAMLEGALRSVAVMDTGAKVMLPEPSEAKIQ